MTFKLENLSLESMLTVALRAMNFFQGESKHLTASEISFLTLISALPDKFKYAPFSLPAKKYLRNLALEKYQWNITPTNLRNYLYALVKKEVIYSDSDGVMYLTTTYAKLLKEIKLCHENDQPWELAFSFPPKRSAPKVNLKGQGEDTGVKEEG